jgi:hypothetical protein
MGEAEEILASVAASADETRVKRAMINKNTIEIDLMPGGRNHCGGDFVLPHLQLQQDKMAGRMPLFVMAPGSSIAFPGAQLRIIWWNAVQKIATHISALQFRHLHQF